MPSAASVKVDKQITSESALLDTSSQQNPIRQALVIIEHKIRNLEKRKVSTILLMFSFCAYFLVTKPVFELT